MEKRPLTLFAQVTVLKAMIISKVVHVMNTCFVPNETIDFLQKFVNDFIWRGHNKLMAKLIQNLVKLGELNQIDIKHLIYRLRAKWMTHLWCDKGMTWFFFFP